MDEKEKEKLLKEIEEYTEKIKKEPGKALNYYYRGECYYSLNKYMNSFNDFKKIIEINVAHTLFCNKGNTYYLDKKNPSTNLEKTDSFDEFYYFNKGNIEFDSEKYKEAIANYDKAIKINSNNASYYNNRGNAFHYLKKYKEAIKDFNSAIELNHNYILAYYNRANNYKHLREYIKAIEDLKIIISLEPSFIYTTKKGNITLYENNKKIKSLGNTTFYDLYLYLDQINEFNKEFNDSLSSHLNVKCDEEFKIAEEKFSSFINKYKKYKKKSSTLENLLEEAELYKKASKEKVKRLVGYLTFADILGWKGIWQKQNTDNGKINNIKKLLSIKNKIDKEFNKYGGNYNLNLISDTFVIYARSLILSNELSKKLIKLCLEEGLLIRGATSYGECYNKDMVYVGQAVDEAASWHEKGEEIVIFYTTSAKLNKNLSDNELEKYHLKNDEVNTKNGKIKTYFINWYDETTEKKFYEIMKKEIIYPEISLKYFNTENRLNKILHPEKEEKK